MRNVILQGCAKRVRVEYVCAASSILDKNHPHDFKRWVIGKTPVMEEKKTMQFSRRRKKNRGSTFHYYFTLSTRAHRCVISLLATTASSSSDCFVLFTAIATK